jgi:cell division protein FtsB
MEKCRKCRVYFTKRQLFLFGFQQLRHNQQQISVLQNEVDTLRSDNVKLYEKIKFLQSYPTKVTIYQLLGNLFKC